MNQQSQKSVQQRSSDFSGDLTDSLAREIKVPGVEEILKSVRAALSAATKTINNSQGGQCGCL
jgi:methylaspartate ammonia-lyase